MKGNKQMMTLKRFQGLAESYGADFRCWPQELRRQAEELAGASEEARAILVEAAALDAVITASVLEEDRVLEDVNDPTAALARLRSGVEGRISAMALRKPTVATALVDNGRRWAFALYLRWLGLATGGGAVIAAGLLVGAMYTSPPQPSPDAAISMLQPEPMQLLGD
jgi:hypothetical protein